MDLTWYSCLLNHWLIHMLMWGNIIISIKLYFVFPFFLNFHNAEEVGFLITIICLAKCSNCFVRVLIFTIINICGPRIKRKKKKQFIFTSLVYPHSALTNSIVTSEIQVPLFYLFLHIFLGSLYNAYYLRDSSWPRKAENALKHEALVIVVLVMDW